MIARSPLPLESIPRRRKYTNTKKTIVSSRVAATASLSVVRGSNGDKVSDSKYHITGTRQSAQYEVSDVVIKGPCDVTIDVSGVENAIPDEQNVVGDMFIRVITRNGPALSGADSTSVNVIGVSQVVVVVMKDTLTSGMVAMEHGAVSGTDNPGGIAGGNTLGMLDSVLSDQQVVTTMESPLDVKNAGTTHRLGELNLAHQAEAAKVVSEKVGRIANVHIPLDMNDAALAIGMVSDVNDASHTLIDNIVVLRVEVTKSVVKKFTTVGEEGTRKVRGAVMSLTDHHESGCIIGETVAKTSKGEVDTLITVTEHHLNLAKKHNFETVIVHNAITLSDHEVTGRLPE